MKSKESVADKFKVWDADNQKYLIGGEGFASPEAAMTFASDWLKIHSDKYNEHSRIEIHKEKDSLAENI